MCVRTLRSVCRKHELIQYELEMAAQDLANKKQQKEELATGVTNELQVLPLLSAMNTH